MQPDKYLPLTINLVRHIRQTCKLPCLRIRFLPLLGLFVLLACSNGCAPPSSPDADQQSSSGSASNDMPEITEETIRERINDTWLGKVPEENKAADPISWNFDEDEPKEIAVVEKQLNGRHATIILDIKTRSAAYVNNPRELAGQIRTEWELKTGWALRRWEIIHTENISMKYKNIPKPSGQNSNR